VPGCNYKVCTVDLKPGQSGVLIANYIKKPAIEPNASLAITPYGIDSVNITAERHEVGYCGRSFTAPTSCASDNGKGIGTPDGLVLKAPASVGDKKFTGWGGACSGTGGCTINMQPGEYKEVTVNYTTQSPGEAGKTKPPAKTGGSTTGSKPSSGGSSGGSSSTGSSNGSPKTSAGNSAGGKTGTTSNIPAGCPGGLAGPATAGTKCPGAKSPERVAAPRLRVVAVSHLSISLAWTDTADKYQLIRNHNKEIYSGSKTTFSDSVKPCSSNEYFVFALQGNSPGVPSSDIYGKATCPQSTNPPKSSSSNNSSTSKTPPKTESGKSGVQMFEHCGVKFLDQKTRDDYKKKHPTCPGADKRVRVT
jgi:hypothetical protein